MPRSGSRCAPSALWTSLILVSLAGCLQNGGVPPPRASLNFPIAVELVDVTADATDAATHLLVANTNFDLGYNGATFQSYDVSALENAIQNDCAAAGVAGEECAIIPAESGEQPGRRGNVLIVAEQGLLVSEVGIGSYAEAIAVSPSKTRVYLPVRSTADVTTVELDAQGRLSCGGDPSTPHDCDELHRHSDRTIETTRDVRLPNEPLDLHVGSLSDFGLPASTGDYLAMSHRGGQLSFFYVPGGNGQPKLTDVLEPSKINNIPLTLPTLTFEPSTRRFWAPTGNSYLFTRATVTLDASSTDPSLASWLRAPAVQLTAVDQSTTFNLRQIVLDPRVGTVHEGRFYAVGLRPAALLIGRQMNGSTAMAIDAILPLGAQPARAQFVEVGGRMLAFVSCYTSRDVYVFDVDRAQLLTIARGISGPFEIALDLVRERMFVVDFRVSVIRLFDLGPLLDCLMIASTPSMAPSCAPTQLGMLGIPSTVEELR